MTCTTCADNTFIVGTPHNDDPNIIGDDTDCRDWLIPCPECSSHMSLQDVWLKAAARFPCGWALTSFTYRDTGQERSQPWPFLLRLDDSDEISAWTLSEPSLEQTLLMHTRDSDPDPDPELDLNGLIQ